MAYTTVIDPEVLAQHLSDPDWAVVDCRFSLADPGKGRSDWAESHVPGATYAHLDDDLSGAVVPGQTGRHPLPEPEAAAEVFSRLGIGPGVQVVAYDDTGGAIAARLWWMLRWLGHDAVAVLDGGWRRWREEGRPTRSGPENRPRREFLPRPRRDLWADAEEVDRLRGDPDYRLLDARAPERYRGEVEPLDPVAGHIPGAVSAPFAGNLDERGRFLPPEALRERFGRLLDGRPPSRAVCYCGSGVTAAHDLLALAHAGLDGARLYPGSWSGWITDPERPVDREDRPPDGGARPAG